MIRTSFLGIIADGLEAKAAVAAGFGHPLFSFCGRARRAAGKRAFYDGERVWRYRNPDT